MSGSMGFVYSELVKHQKCIDDLHRNMSDIDNGIRNMGSDVRDLLTFREVYREDIIESKVMSSQSYIRINELNQDIINLNLSLNDFIKNFNQWAVIIQGLQKSVEDLKKENLELKTTINNMNKTK